MTRREMRAGDPALNGLALYPGDWPTVAREWLAAGFDSQLLRDFAGLTAEDVDELSEFMPDVLRSLSLHIDDGVDFWTVRFELSGFAERCRTAVAVVQSDLDRTGYSEFRLRAVDVTSGPYEPVQMCAGFLDGTCGSEMNNPMTADMDDDALVAYAALTAGDTLLLVAGTRWPRCVQHRTKHLLPFPPSASTPDARDLAAPSSWWCNQIDTHRMAAIGELRSSF